METIKEAIHEYFVTELATERASFESDENLLEQGIIDSLAIVNVDGRTVARAVRLLPG